MNTKSKHKILSLNVELPLFTQKIYIGSNLDEFIIGKLKSNYSRNVVIVSESVYPKTKELIKEISDKEPIIIKSLEENKSFDFIRTLINECHSRMLNRDSYLIGIGGGMIGDAIGFLSSIYMRGVKFVYIPTTLLSQCDSTINKVAVSVDSTKNLVGSFYSPHITFCDTNYLTSLSTKQISYGLVEVIKHALITDSTRLKKLLKSNLKDKLKEWHKYPWDEIIYESLKIKASIVKRDPFDRHGMQRGLNYGHTFGHSLEGLSGYQFPHGLAVGIGIKIAGYISNKLNMLTDQELELQNNLLALAQLDLTLSKDFDIDTFIKLLKKDKVNNGTGVRLVLLERLGSYQLKGGVSEKLIKDTITQHLIAK